MARAQHTIEVLIVGDARKLVGAFKDVNTATGGVLAAAGKAFLATKVVGEVFDFAKGALSNADKYHDALDRISGAITPEFAKSIENISGDFSKIGLSAPEVADLAAKFADLAISAQVSEPAISKALPDILTLATAISATTGKTVDEVIDDIGKAAMGNQKPISEYGVVVDKALNPDARLLSILDQLSTKFPDAAKAADDLAGSQSELDAKWETFTTHVGAALEGPLTDVVDWVNDMIDAIPSAIDGWTMLGDRIAGAFENALSPLARLNDALGDLGDTLRGIPFLGELFGGLGIGKSGISESDVRRASDLFDERNLQGRP